MPTITINGTAYDLPEGEGAPSKVNDYNEALIALAGMTESAWASWTPTLTNIAIGTGGGALLSAKYARIGKLVFCRVHIKLGSSGASVTGMIQFNLPVTRAAYSGFAGATILGNATALDTSDGDKFYHCSVVNISTTVAGVLAHLVSGTYAVEVQSSSTVPFTWAAGDEVHAQFFYESV